MAEINDEARDTVPASSLSGGNEKVGDLLRKERTMRRITHETIAKDLKLNVSYIKALEDGNYDALPVDPYVRVYIKSLAKYLSLDTDAIMKRFYKERGLIMEDKTTSSRIDISIQKNEKNPTLVIAAVLIVILAVFAFIANSKGWLNSGDTLSDVIVNDGPDTTAVDPESALDDGDSTIAALGAPQDSGTGKAPPRP